MSELKFLRLEKMVTDNTLPTFVPWCINTHPNAIMLTLQATSNDLSWSSIVNTFICVFFD